MAVWTDLGSVKSKEVVSATAQLHTASQWLGRFGRGLTPPKEDDSHTSFVWNANLQAFVTDGAEAPNGAKKVQVGLRPATLALFLFEDGDIADGMSLHNQTDDDAGAWLRKALRGNGFTLDRFNADAPYAAPSSAVANGKAYDAIGPVGALNEIARGYDNVQPVLETVREEYLSVTPGPSDVRSWPHHFDTGLFITLEDAPFESARGIGVGLAVPDSVFPEFYFYTYPWPRHPRKGLPRLKSAGKIHKNGFYGGVLPISKLAKQKNQAETVTLFFEETVAMWKAVLDNEMAKD